MKIFLDRIDSVPLQNDNFSPDFDSWLSILVDTMNETLKEIQDQLNGEGNATFITRKTSAEIDALINMNATPVLENGIWIDTTLGKLRFLVTPAVPGISNGVTEVVTSV